ncbi:MAG TPA: type II secretion system protein [Candidatus Omnitrophota bacterium]|nr:type II secretion system protein [Candidatus Omnitrophota bacterium]
MRLQRKKGFTLVELLIVTAILGLLAAMALPRILDPTGKVKTTEAINIMSAIRRGMLVYYDANRSWPNISVSTDFPRILGVTYSTPNCGWTFSTAASGATAVVTATHDGGTGTLTLDVVSGGWGGTGDYNPVNGKYWPNLGT